MTSKLIQLEDGTLVEIAAKEGEAQQISSRAAESIPDSTIDSIKPLLQRACKPVYEVWKELNENMYIQQAEIELGLGFEAEGNLFITRSKGNANLTVKFILMPKPEDNTDNA